MKMKQRNGYRISHEFTMATYDLDSRKRNIAFQEKVLA